VDDLLIPPLNFGRVCRGVYRSGFPGKKNFSFLKVCVGGGGGGNLSALSVTLCAGRFVSLIVVSVSVLVVSVLTLSAFFFYDFFQRFFSSICLCAWGLCFDAVL
jgi:hypothetical protein